MSGTLRIITNQPKLDKWEGGIDVEGNKFGPGAAGGKVEGFINVPIGQNAALRASAFYQHDGGYIDNVYGERIYTQAHTLSDGSVADVNGAYNNSKYVKNNFNDVNTAGGRAALKVDLNENWTVTPAIMYQNLITHGTFLYGPLGHQSDPATAPLGDLQVHDFTPDRTTDDWYMASMTINGKLSNWDITYSGSYFDRRQDITADYSYFTVAYDQLYTDYTYFSHNGTAIDPSQTYHSHDKYTKFSQELRISSPGHDRFRVTAGLFMQRQTDAHIADYIVNGLSTSDQAAGIQIPGAPGDDVYYTNFNRVDRDYAMFGEASYDIIDHVTLTGGIRGFIADNTLNGFSGSQSGFYHAGAALGCAASTTVFTCPNIDKKLVESGETHKISLKWQVDPTKMLYATYSTGFRPGGNNRAAYVQVGNVYKEQSPPPFNADKLTNYEIGWKTSLFDHKLRFNGAVFLENWNNVQYAQPGVLGIIFTMNASEARSKGVEAELAWRVVHGLTLSASGTYVDAKLAKDFTCPLTAGCGYYLNGNPVNLGSVIAPAGTRLPVTPKVKVSATARYETKLADFDAFLQGGLTYQGDVPNSLRPDYQAVLGSSAAFTTADFSAGIAKDQWTLSTFISNAFDVRGALSKNLACSSTPCLTYARSYITKPQQFGLRAGYKF